MLEPRNVPIYGKDFTNMVKDIGREISWIIVVSPNCSHMYLYERKAEAGWTTQREKPVWGWRSERFEDVGLELCSDVP